MSSRLTVETSELQSLSTKQDDAAATFNAAGDTTSYVEVKVPEDGEYTRAHGER